jgi:hypothetical protein
MIDDVLPWQLMSDYYMEIMPWNYITLLLMDWHNDWHVSHFKTKRTLTGVLVSFTSCMSGLLVSSTVGSFREYTFPGVFIKSHHHLHCSFLCWRKPWIVWYFGKLNRGRGHSALFWKAQVSDILFVGLFLLISSGMRPASKGEREATFCDTLFYGHRKP